MKTKAMQVVQNQFMDKYKDLDNWDDCQKRIEFGKDLCTDGKYKFTFKGIEDSVSTSPMPQV